MIKNSDISESIEDINAADDGAGDIITDREIIERWITENNGKPALIHNTNGSAQKVGLRIDFPGIHDEELLSEAWSSERVSWDEFFKIFEEQKMAFIIDEGETDKTMAYRFVYRESSEE